MSSKKYTQPKVAIMREGHHVVVTEKVTPYKMSGSLISKILGKSIYGTPFSVACEMLGIAKEDKSSSKSIQAGNALEWPIIEYAKKKYQNIGIFANSEETFPGHGGEHGSRIPDFNDEYFSGNVDGLVYEGQDAKDGNDLSRAFILEVKTTSNPDAWLDGIPEYYDMQVQLYNYFLCKRDKAYVLMASLTPDEKADPATFVPTDDNVFLFTLDIDIEKTEQMLIEAMDWYDAYIRQGITPDYNLGSNIDSDLWEHLRDISKSDDDIQDMVDRLEIVEQQIAERSAEYANLSSESDDLRKRLKDIMVANSIEEIPTTSARFKVQITRTKGAVSIDRNKLIADGIDVKKYELRKPDTIKLNFKPIKEDKDKNKE